MASNHDPNRDYATELEPMAEEGSQHITDWLKSSRTFRGMVTNLPPVLSFLIGKFGPYALSFPLDKVAPTLFGDTKMGRTLVGIGKSLIINTATKVGREMTNFDPSSPKSKARVQELVEETAGELRLKIDPVHNLHMDGCPFIAMYEQTLPQPNKRKGQQGQQAPKPNSLKTITVDQAIHSGLSMSPCCSGDIQATVKKEATKRAPKQEEDFSGKSPAFVLGSATPSQRKKVFEWLQTLSQEDSTRVMEGMRRLDSLKELKVLLEMSPQQRIDYLSWLEEDQEKAKQTLKLVYEFIEKHGQQAWDEIVRVISDFKQWEQGMFGLMADEAQQRLMDRNNRPGQAPKLRLLQWLKIVRR